MFRILLLLLLSLHGLIHLLGFVKAFRIAPVEQLSAEISKPLGLAWLGSTVLFLGAAIAFFLQKEWWWMPALGAVVLSQALIFSAWGDAKFGTIANLLLLMAVILGYGAWQFEHTYQKDVAEGLQRTTQISADLLTERDLQPLPGPVQKYLRYAGVVGKPKVKNMRIVFEGEMREKGQDWFAFTSEQYNFYDEMERHFFMKAKVKGLPTHGYHDYQDGQAGMLIKVLSLFPVVNLHKGDVLFQTETVTVFNDMCMFAPATLIDQRIQWEAIDERSARATFTNRGTAITAVLYFNEAGQLIDFVSDDRYALRGDQMDRYRFSTPISNYQDLNGYRLGTYGEATWHYPDGPFAYGKFRLREITYNVEK